MRRVTWTQNRQRELSKVQKEVNSIVPQDELVGYDHWSFSVGNRGDCEDYDILKRHYPMAMGWPASALLLVVVNDENGLGHAVLIVRTSRGDILLDNKIEEVKYWYEALYIWLTRQSYTDPRI